MGEETKKEENKVEEKKEEKTEEKKEEKTEEKEKPLLPFVLFVDLHCVGCAKKIEKSILKIRGVEGVAINMMKNEVTIKGVVQPEAICDKIMKITKRKAKVLSPHGESIPQILASQVSGTNTVELNVNMHCEACALQLKRKILKMKGVIEVEIELSSSKVRVTGTMDPNKLVDYVYRRTKKQAQIVPQPEEPKPVEEPKPEPEPKPEDEKKEEPKLEEEKKEEVGEKKDENAFGEGKKEEEVKEEEGVKMEINYNMYEENSMQRMMYGYQPLYHVYERMPPPQLFSDENPNACCIS